MKLVLVCVILHMSQLGNTALMMAAEEGYTEVVVELIKAGANLNLQNKVQFYSILCMDRHLRQTTDIKLCKKSVLSVVLYKTGGCV